MCASLYSCIFGLGFSILVRLKSLFDYFSENIMLYGLLVSVLVVVCLLLILVILIQQGKGGIGLGGSFGGAQVLFGGSGGQDLFQKTTWVLGVIFMSGALMLTLMKSKETKQIQYLATNYTAHLPINQK